MPPIFFGNLDALGLEMPSVQPLSRLCVIGDEDPELIEMDETPEPPVMSYGNEERKSPRHIAQSLRV